MSQINVTNALLVEQTIPRYATAGTLEGVKQFSSLNASIRIHEDTPKVVRDRYDEQILLFQSVEPDIQDVSNPRWERTQVLGRSENYLSYMGGDNRVINMTLNFMASLEQGDFGNDDMALRCVRWLQSLQYPTYEDGIAYPPPLLKLIFGRMLSQRGVLTGCQVSYGQTYGQLDNTGTMLSYPIVARAAIEFTCVHRNPLEAFDVMPLPGVTLYPVNGE